MQIDLIVAGANERPRYARIVGQWLLIGTLIAGAAACSSGDDAGEKRAAAKASRDSAPRKSNAQLAEEDAVRNMVAAVPAGKGPSDVDVKFEIGEAPTIGKPVAVRVAIVPTEGCKSLEVVFRAEGLELAAGGAISAVENPPIGVPIRHEVSIVPRSDGIFTLSAVVMTESGDGQVARTYSIPVIVGLGMSEPAEAPATTASTSAPTR